MSNQLGTLLASIHTHIKSLSVVATQELETLIKDLDSTPEILDCISCVTVSLNKKRDCDTVKFKTVFQGVR